MHAFDPNDYRKRVLAAVERRGGLEESDAFELYDIPIAEAARLSDVEVAARVQQVWTLWQKLRDHPKFRVLAGLLVDAHRELSEPLLETGSRLIEADRVQQLRARREAERFEMLDAAIDRLVQRHGGIPAAKIPGLEDIGRMGGLTPAEIAAHVRRHRIIDDSPTPTPPPALPTLSPERRRQIRKLLLELERLREGDPVPTLLYVLGLGFADAHHTAEIRFRADALRARSRELPPGRIRVVLDELLVHIADLLEPGGDLVDAYLHTVIEDVTDQLRPQVRAAVLVEDLLVAADFDYLLGEAITAGLDRATAERVLVSLTDELGTVVEGREHLAAPPGSAAAPGTVTPEGRSARGSTPSSTAAAATSGPAAGSGSATGGSAPGAQADSSGGSPSQGRAGATGGSAGRTADRAESSTAAAGSGRGSAGDDGAQDDSGGWNSGTRAPDPATWQRTPYGTGGARDEATGAHGGVSGARAGRPGEAALRAARAALRAGRPREAAGFVEDARRGVGDDRAGVTSVRAVADEIERVLAEAAVHWRAAVSACAGRRFVEALTEHLDFLERRAADVANPDPRGGSRELLIGRARAAVMEAGRMFEAAPLEPPELRMRAILGVLEVCADHAEARAALAHLRIGAPGRVTASRKPDGTMVIAWLASVTEQVEYRVTRLLADGSWRVVGRTRGTALEDGGATTGAVPVYGVVASVSGRTSEMARTDGRSDTDASASTDTDQPSGMPTVRGLTEQRGLLVFEWPTGITEVMVVARPDAPPIDPQDPHAQRWKVTNMRYEIEGGVRIPAEIPRPCHIAVASCRRDAGGSLTVATGFAADARIRWVR